MAYYPANFYARRFIPAHYFPGGPAPEPPPEVSPVPVIYSGRGAGGGGGGRWSSNRARVDQDDTTLAPNANTLQSDEDLITFITVFLNTIYA